MRSFYLTLTLLIGLFAIKGTFWSQTELQEVHEFLSKNKTTLSSSYSNEDLLNGVVPTICFRNGDYVPSSNEENAIRLITDVNSIESIEDQPQLATVKVLWLQLNLQESVDNKKIQRILNMVPNTEVIYLYFTYAPCVSSNNEAQCNLDHLRKTVDVSLLRDQRVLYTYSQEE
ncbi:hypothetical protein [Parvicella tangerina]|uniref:Uncharacterized protein n=1 Tax=Parvicella tangerina TaxID=2829795 RepID=A0A916JQT3_9FLAO|nr:hypothetical protein [Parvicella tangerina]CAG5087199.1 hypothetical protein CRYO30217_03413 [Parvicella tangerina]